ncbi:MAG: alpha/beta hydrolase fold domain-containing protein, partial [Pedosphaera sp.]|nr:alpha/beta hydrolase fold domain-containing protein [Pedosphaera sp.]
MKKFRFTIYLFLLASSTLVPVADTVVNRLQKMDRDGDGKLSREEAPQSIRKFKFDLADRNKDGFLDTRELQRLLDKLNEKKKTPIVKSSEPVVPKAGQMRVVRNIVYQKRDKAAKGQNKLDIYLPRDKTGFPVLFWIHGGGLHSGDKSKIAEVAARFVAEGIGLVSTNYRLYPEATYPTQIEDVADAFAWVHQNIVNHGGDPRKLFVAGGSAGGHLAALITLNEAFLKKRGLSGRAIRGAIPISGLMDVSRVGAARRVGIWGDKDSTHRIASPLHHARKGAPPLLLLHAEHDTPDRRQQNQMMFDALKNAGHVDVAIHELKDRTHNSIRPNLVNQDDSGARYILKFIRRLCV